MRVQPNPRFSNDLRRNIPAIERFNTARVKEHASGILKADTVFAKVDGSFIPVPFEVHA